MRNLTLAAATVLLAANPAAAQSAQELLDTRYDRALAAGYKALMLCSAIANTERNAGALTRTTESVHEWELTGIYPTLDPIIRDLPFEIVRAADGRVNHVEVQWATDMAPRYARHDAGAGCKVLPIGASAPATDRWPSDSWERPFTVMHSAGGGPLADAARAAFTNDYGEGARSTAVIVLVDGLTKVAEFDEGRRGEPQRTWSVAKSIAATLVGAAVHRGAIDVNQSAGLGADQSDPRRAITIDQALRMATGRYSDTPGNRTDPLYWGGSTVDERAQDWPLLHMPGTVFRYANNDTLAAVQAIEATFEAHPPAEFFAKLGMHHTVAETDWQGNYVLSSQVWATAEDLAKLGQLYLNDGVLPDGTRILPKGWREYVSSPSGPQPDGAFGYGAGFWLMNKSDGVPPDTFAAFGNRGQYVVIVPSRDVVIVRRGEDPVGSRFDIAAFTRDVLAALD
ncbi:serine hydrolase domain-containing protein [Qipengyuania sp. ASV99]|uniref:serine hydrolase domain-containing protein n=1 Tax=Qipengyuania sp. ASV99 TaxID=3399681 RepID=UPI003A4C6FAF